MKLCELHENENNPRKVSDEDLERLAEKLKRNEGGLKAIRIAYIMKGDRKVVISGNTRLKALMKIHGGDWDVPDEYVQDLTSLSEAERHEFIVNANKSDGSWDLDKLLEQYSTDELKEYGVEEALRYCPSTGIDDIPDEAFDADMKRIDKVKERNANDEKTTICPHCGKETRI